MSDKGKMVCQLPIPVNHRYLPANNPAIAEMQYDFIPLHQSRHHEAAPLARLW
jgi:hypothetical protein